MRCCDMSDFRAILMFSSTHIGVHVSWSWCIGEFDVYPIFLTSFAWIFLSIKNAQYLWRNASIATEITSRQLLSMAHHSLKKKYHASSTTNCIGASLCTSGRAVSLYFCDSAASGYGFSSSTGLRDLNHMCWFCAVPYRLNISMPFPFLSEFFL